jgi:hypothetical protein
LDAASMVDPDLSAFNLLTVWPHPDMQDVPTHFVPEMPNPVPGVDQMRLGYPITLQYSRRGEDESVRVRMEVREKSASGAKVDCYFSTPESPTNPVLAPAEACCLMPKSPLKSGTTYHVEVELVGAGVTKTWTFRTRG